MIARLQALSSLASACAEPDIADEIARACRIVARAVRAGEVLLACGNGGSAAQADHLVAELVGRYRTNRAPYPAIALTCPAVLTCVGNDWDYREVFARQVRAWSGRDAVLVALSTSGASPNVIEAVRTAWQQRMWVVAITGEGGDALRGMTDAHVRIPSSDTGLVQELTEHVLHSMCEAIDTEVSE